MAEAQQQRQVPGASSPQLAGGSPAAGALPARPATAPVRRPLPRTQRPRASTADAAGQPWTPGSTSSARRSIAERRASSAAKPTAVTHPKAWTSVWRRSDGFGSPIAFVPRALHRSRPGDAAAPDGPSAAPRPSPAATLRFTRPRTAAAAPRTPTAGGAPAGGCAVSGGASLAGGTRPELDEWGLPSGPPSAAAAAAAQLAQQRCAPACAASSSPSPGGTNTTLAAGYALGTVVGQGGFCKVRVATHSLSGARVAVKVTDKRALLDANDRRRVGREVRVLRRLACGAVIRLFDVVSAPNHIFVVMEYADGGSLLDHVRSAGRLPEHRAARLFQQLLAGVQFCHAHGVIHRDVKLENALLDRDGNVKLIDFGLAALVPSLATMLRVHCGSPSYAAPEIVARKPYRGPPVDVWSLGVVLFACVAGYLPFHAPPGAKNELSAKILKGQFSFPEGVSCDLQELLRAMLVVDPARRADTEGVNAYRWMRHALAQHPAPVPHGPPAALDEQNVDCERLEALEQLGVPRGALLADLQAGETNYMTASYHLWGCGVGGAPSGFGPAPPARAVTPEAQGAAAHSSPAVESSAGALGATTPPPSRGGRRLSGLSWVASPLSSEGGHRPSVAQADDSGA